MDIYILLAGLPFYLFALYIYEQRNKELFYSAFIVLSYLSHKFFMTETGAYFFSHSVVVACLFAFSAKFAIEDLKLIGVGNQFGETGRCLKNLMIVAAVIHSLVYIEVVSLTAVFSAYFSWLNDASLVLLVNSTFAFVVCRLAERFIKVAKNNEAELRAD